MAMAEAIRCLLFLTRGIFEYNDYTGAHTRLEMLVDVDKFVLGIDRLQDANLDDTTLDLLAANGSRNQVVPNLLHLIACNDIRRWSPDARHSGGQQDCTGLLSGAVIDPDLNLRSDSEGLAIQWLAVLKT